MGEPTFSIDEGYSLKEASLAAGIPFTQAGGDKGKLPTP
jgi:hypothetical protein